MRRFLLMSLLLLAGCNLIGPRKRATTPPKPDMPYLPIPEQEAKNRERLAYPDSAWVGPRTYSELPSQQYGQLSH